MTHHFRPVALEHASRLINHGPTVLVTSAAGAHRNVMAAAWSMPVEFTPPRIAVVIDKRTFTRELITASGAFGLCLPGAGLADLTYAVGSKSGRAVDKFARHGIVARTGPVLGVPLIESGCAAWLECRLIREPHSLNDATLRRGAIRPGRRIRRSFGHRARGAQLRMSLAPRTAGSIPRPSLRGSGRAIRSCARPRRAARGSGRRGTFRCGKSSAAGYPRRARHAAGSATRPRRRASRRGAR